MHRPWTHRLSSAAGSASPLLLDWEQPPSGRPDRDGRGIPRMVRRNVWLIIARRCASGAPFGQGAAIETRRGVDRAHDGELRACGLSRMGFSRCRTTVSDSSLLQDDAMSQQSVGAVHQLRISADSFARISREIPRGDLAFSNVWLMARRLREAEVIIPVAAIVGTILHQSDDRKAGCLTTFWMCSRNHAYVGRGPRWWGGCSRERQHAR